MSPLWHPGALVGESLNLTHTKPPSAIPGSGPNNSGLNTDNVVCCSTAAFKPPAEWIRAVAVWCYMAGHTAAVNTRGAIWNGPGVVLASSSTISVPKGSGVAGGQFWTRFAFDAPCYLNSGTSYFPGWWRQANQDHEWSVFGVGNFSFETLASFGNLVTLTTCTGSGFICGAAGIYIEYDLAVPHLGEQSW